MTPSIRFAWCTRGPLHRSLSYQPHLAIFSPSPRYFLEAQVYSLFDDCGRRFSWDSTAGVPAAWEILSVGSSVCPFTILVLRNGKPYSSGGRAWGLVSFISTIQYKKMGLINYHGWSGLPAWFTTRVKTISIPRDCGSLESTCKMGGSQSHSFSIPKSYREWSLRRK